MATATTDLLLAMTTCTFMRPFVTGDDVAFY
jgi:hypothetical protein